MKLLRSPLLWALAAFVLLAPSAFAAQVWIPDARTLSSPGATTHDGNFWVVYRKYSDDYLAFSTTAGTGSWVHGTVSDTVVSSGVSAVSFNGKVYGFYRPYSDLVKFATITPITGGFSTAVGTVPGASAAGDPEATVYNNRLYVFWNGSDNFMRYTSTADGTNWSAVSTVPFGFSSVGVGVSEFNGRLYLTYRKGTGIYIYYGYMDSAGNWFGENLLSGSEAVTSPFATSHENRLWVLFKGKDSYNIYYRKLDTWGTWSTQQALEDNSRTGVPPSAATFQSQLWVVYRGENSTWLYYNTVD